MGAVRKTAPAVLAVLIGLAGAASAADEAAVGEPTFTVQQATIDLGSIRAGEDAIAVFRFTNQGDADVRILRAKPS